MPTPPQYQTVPATTRMTITAVVATVRHITLRGTRCLNPSQNQFRFSTTSVVPSPNCRSNLSLSCSLKAGEGRVLKLVSFWAKSSAVRQSSSIAALDCISSPARIRSIYSENFFSISTSLPILPPPETVPQLAYRTVKSCSHIGLRQAEHPGNLAVG